MRRHKRHIVIVVVPVSASAIGKFVLIDIIGGTALYYLLKAPLHSVLAATLGSMAGPMLIRRSLDRPRKQR